MLFRPVLQRNRQRIVGGVVVSQLRCNSMWSLKIGPKPRGATTGAVEKANAASSPAPSPPDPLTQAVGRKPVRPDSQERPEWSEDAASALRQQREEQQRRQGESRTTTEQPAVSRNVRVEQHRVQPVDGAKAADRAAKLAQEWKAVEEVTTTPKPLDSPTAEKTGLRQADATPAQAPQRTKLAAPKPEEILLMIRQLVPGHTQRSFAEVMRMLPKEASEAISTAHHGLGYFLKRYGQTIDAEQQVEVDGDKIRRKGAQKPVVKPEEESLPKAWDQPVQKTVGTAAPAKPSPSSSSPATPAETPSATKKGAPPPPPPFSKLPSGNSNSPGAQFRANQSAFMSNLTGRVGARTPQDVLELLIECIPTYWVDINAVQGVMSPDAKELYVGKLKFATFLKKYRFFFDVRQQSGNCFEVKLRDEVKHPKRGIADAKFTSTLVSNDLRMSLGLANAPANVPAVPTASKSSSTQGSTSRKAENLLTTLYRACSDEFVFVPEFERSLPKTIYTHPGYDTLAGVVGLLERNPEYFQIVDGKVRRRPANVAPNSLDNLDAKNSVSAEIFTKVMAALPEDPTVSVNTAVLMSALNEEEKQKIRSEFRSFPRFLRLHGGVITVSTDNLSVKRFSEDLMPKAPDVTVPVEEPEAAPSPSEQRSSASTDDTVRPDDISSVAANPVADASGNRLPDAMPAEPDATWGLKELFDALPLVQAAEIDDALFMLSPAIRNMLPADRNELIELLKKYPAYFAVWPFPDDESVTVIQRASVPANPVPLDELINQLYPLIPQGGVKADRLMRKVPPPVQRYFYRNGLQRTLKEHPEHFAVAAGKVMKLG